MKNWNMKKYSNKVGQISSPKISCNDLIFITIIKLPIVHILLQILFTEEKKTTCVYILVKQQTTCRQKHLEIFFFADGKISE